MTTPSPKNPDVRTLTDFVSGDSDLGWFVVNDTVMGGQSSGTFRTDEGILTFTGITNTNGGGFSSIRTAPLQLDLSDQAGIQLKVKGDGRRYTWRLTSSARWRGRQVSYWADFDPGEGSWNIVNIPFGSFVPRYRGTVLEGPDIDSADITGMGLMIYDDRDGPFQLQLANVSSYQAESE